MTYADLYDVTDEAERQRLMTLLWEGKQQAWWQPYDLDFEHYVVARRRCWPPLLPVHDRAWAAADDFFPASHA